IAEHVRAQPATVELATGQQKIGTESCRDLRQRRCARHHHLTRNLIGIEYGNAERSAEHTSELQSLMCISYAVFCLIKKKHKLLSNKTPQPKHLQPCKRH